MPLRYVKTLEEVRNLQKLYATPEFESFRGIAASFRTDPDVIAAILPPPLEPADEPIASVSVSHIGVSNTLQPFGAGGLNVRCRYEGIVGDYPITMPMSTDSAVIFGRELYGEPKKVANIHVRRDGDEITGTIERYGHVYIEVRGRVVEQVEPGESPESSRFYFKFMPAPDGRGFDNDPVLVRVRHTGHTRLIERLEGEVLLRESHDPVADIPIRELLGVSYSEGDTYTHGEILTRVPGESFLPYMFGKVDDLELLAGAGPGELLRGNVLTVKFGVVATSSGALDDKLAEVDALGFDTFYVVDHPSFDQPDAWTYLGWVAAQTQNMRLGTHVTGMPFHHPLQLAKQVASVDTLSGGRAVLGIGTAYEHADFEPYGFEMLDFLGRIEQLEEGIRILKSFWTQELTEFAGKHYQLEGGATFSPKPVQEPHPPIIVGLNRRGALLRLAARQADAINTWQLGPAQVAEVAEHARAACVEVGRDPGHLALTSDVILARGQTQDAADQIAGGIAQMARGWGRSEKVTQWNHSGVFFGDGDNMLEQVAAFAETGVEEVAISSSDFDDIAWFSENVIAKSR